MKSCTKDKEGPNCFLELISVQCFYFILLNGSFEGDNIKNLQNILMFSIKH